MNCKIKTFYCCVVYLEAIVSNTCTWTNVITIHRLCSTTSDQFMSCIPPETANCHYRSSGSVWNVIFYYKILPDGRLEQATYQIAFWVLYLFVVGFGTNWHPWELVNQQRTHLHTRRNKSDKCFVNWHLCCCVACYELLKWTFDNSSASLNNIKAFMTTQAEGV